MDSVIEVAVPNYTLHDYIFTKAAQYPKRTALIDVITGEKCTYGELIYRAQRLAKHLQKLNVVKGDVISLISDNSIEYPIIVLAVSCVGAATSTMNPFLSDQEIITQINNCHAKMVFVNNMLCEKLSRVSVVCPSVKMMMTFKHNSVYMNLEDLLKEDVSEIFEKVAIDPAEDVVLLPYSSGTTGIPKGVMLTHRNVVSNAVHHQHPRFTLKKNCCQEIYICLPPFAHIYGLSILLLLSLSTCETLLLLRMPKFSLDIYLSTVEKYKVTVIHILPTLVTIMCKSPIINRFNLSSVHTAMVGGSTVGSEASREFTDKLGIQLLQGYGMTESSPGIALATKARAKHGSVGCALPNTQCKVINRNGEKLGPGEVGEMLARGPQIMKGYLGNTEASAVTVDKEGWLHTGDLVYFDTEGDYFIQGRIKDLIKYKGYQVSPTEIENLLMEHDHVNDVCVIGVRDEMVGELPTAFVIRQPNSSVTEDQLLRFTKGRLAAYKRIRGGIHFLNEIPKSPSGKKLRRHVLQNFESNKSKL